jgi:hypothetical protein
LIKTELDAKPSGEIAPPWSTTLEVFMGKHLHLGKELRRRRSTALSQASRSSVKQ